MQTIKNMAYWKAKFSDSEKNSPLHLDEKKSQPEVEEHAKRAAREKGPEGRSGETLKKGVTKGALSTIYGPKIKKETGETRGKGPTEPKKETTDPRRKAKVNRMEKLKQDRKLKKTIKAVGTRRPKRDMKDIYR